MSRQVVVRLTIPQALALSHAAGLAFYSPADTAALFRNGSERAAAYRAASALDEAIGQAGGWRRVLRRRDRAKP